MVKPTFMGATGAYDSQILTRRIGLGLDIQPEQEEIGVVEEQHTAETIGVSVSYPTRDFTWPCSTPDHLLPVLRLFMRVGKEREAGILSFGVCVNGGVDGVCPLTDGLVEKVTEAFAAAVDIPKSEVRLGCLPIEGNNGPLAAVVYFANIQNYV